AWCLRASRYQEAAEAGLAPNVYLASTDEAALRTIPKATLDAHAAHEVRSRGRDVAACVALRTAKQAQRSA
ncbi:MAG: DUF2237 family protein, partial [Polyangiaceae bacterium]|nr:DUF2237 family protein [Polyangiaceae bacterium]